MGRDSAAGCSQHQTGYINLSWPRSKAKACFLSCLMILAVDHCIQTRSGTVSTGHPEVLLSFSQTIQQVKKKKNYCSSNIAQCILVLGFLWSDFTHLYDFSCYHWTLQHMKA